MVKLILVRHGLTTYNKLKIYQGQYDSPLDELGYLQAELTAEHIASTYHIDAIYASDLSRTINTATPTAKRLGLPFETTKAFREIDVGHWANRKIADVQIEFPDEVRAYREDPGTFHFPGGESFSNVFARADRKIREIAERHDGETVLIFTHGGIIRALLTVWKGLPIERMREIRAVPNTAITVAEYDGGAVKLLLEMDNSHLPEEMR